MVLFFNELCYTIHGENRKRDLFSLYRGQISFFLFFEYVPLEWTIHLLNKRLEVIYTVNKGGFHQ